MQAADYWKKLDNIVDDSILWNIPEQKTGRIAVIGGNLENCMVEIKNTEFLNSLPIKSANLLLPSAYKVSFRLLLLFILLTPLAQAPSQSHLPSKILRLTPTLSFSPVISPKTQSLKLLLLTL